MKTIRNKTIDLLCASLIGASACATSFEPCEIEDKYTVRLEGQEVTYTKVQDCGSKTQDCELAITLDGNDVLLSDKNCTDKVAYAAHSDGGHIRFYSRDELAQKGLTTILDSYLSEAKRQSIGRKPDEIVYNNTGLDNTYE